MGALAASLTSMLEESSAAVVRAVQHTLEAAVQQQCDAVRSAADAATADGSAAVGAAEAACSEAAQAVRQGGVQLDGLLAELQLGEQAVGKGLGAATAGLQEAVRGCGDTGAATATLEEGLQGMGDTVATVVEDLVDDAEAETVAVQAALREVAAGAGVPSDAYSSMCCLLSAVCCRLRCLRGAGGGRGVGGVCRCGDSRCCGRTGLRGGRPRVVGPAGAA